MCDFSKDIIEARICSYCGNKPKYVDSKVIYGKHYGFIYLCRPCDAYVGVHHGNTRKALGRLANKELRQAKQEAHKYLDNIWQQKVAIGEDKGKARRNAYKGVGKLLGIPKKHTHIGMFDLETCKRVIEICKP